MAIRGEGPEWQNRIRDGEKGVWGQHHVVTKAKKRPSTTAVFAYNIQPTRLLLPSAFTTSSMASVLQPPLTHSLSPRSPVSGGILLNPSPYRLPSPLPPSSHPSRSNQSLSSSTSSSEDVNTPPSSDHSTPPSSLMDSLALHYASDEDHVLRSRRSSAPEYDNLRGRRIRFAPLPDPRRAVLVTEGGQELPLPSVFDDYPSGIPESKL